MKKIICFILLTGFSFCGMAQQVTPAIATPDEEYLKISKNQKTAAIVLLSGGGALALASFLIPVTDEELGDIFWRQRYPTGRAILLWGGLGAMAGSIPLFIASARNHKRAFGMTAQLKIETATNLQKAAWVKSRYPALGIKISL